MRTESVRLTKKQAELVAAMRAAVESGEWERIADPIGVGSLVIRWRQERATPTYLPACYWGSPTYSRLVFLTFMPGRPATVILGVSPAPWVGRQDSVISLKRAFEVLANPVKAVA